MELDKESEVKWDALYSELETRPEGVPGAVTGRASDMVMKLALIYALTDGDDAIRLTHLRAGLAVWRYCETTAYALFGGLVSASVIAEPDPLYLWLLNFIKATPGVKRSELTSHFKNTDNADAIGVSLEALRVKGMAYPVMVKSEGAGRPGERWYPGSGEKDNGEGDREELNNHKIPSSYTTSQTLTPNPLSGMVVGEGVEEGSKEVNNSLPDSDQVINYFLPSFLTG